MTEFAVMLPIFITLAFGLIEFGRAMMLSQVLINAAREGSRMAALAGTTEADVYQTIDNYMTSTSVSGHTRSVSPNPSSAQEGDPITVTVSVDYTGAGWGIMWWLGSKTINGKVIMRKE